MPEGRKARSRGGVLDDVGCPNPALLVLQALGRRLVFRREALQAKKLWRWRVEIFNCSCEGVRKWGRRGEKQRTRRFVDRRGESLWDRGYRKRERRAVRGAFAAVREAVEQTFEGRRLCDSVGV